MHGDAGDHHIEITNHHTDKQTPDKLRHFDVTTGNPLKQPAQFATQDQARQHHSQCPKKVAAVYRLFLLLAELFATVMIVVCTTDFQTVAPDQSASNRPTEKTANDQTESSAGHGE